MEIIYAYYARDMRNGYNILVRKLKGKIKFGRNINRLENIKMQREGSGSRRMRWAGHVARMGRRGMHIGYWWEIQKERDH
jgi:hypothetical protein